jgi:preprotein translocase subunit SecE
VEEVLPAVQLAHAAQGNEVGMANEVVRSPAARVDLPRRRGMSRVVDFYHEVIAEMRKVTWPDQPQLRDTTFKILLFVLFVAAVIALIDVIVQGIFVRGVPSLFTR